MPQSVSGYGLHAFGHVLHAQQENTETTNDFEKNLSYKRNIHRASPSEIESTGLT